jgi:hypothetical protein
MKSCFSTRGSMRRTMPNVGNSVKPYTLETSGLPKFVSYSWDERFSLAPVGCLVNLQINVRKRQPNLASELLTHFRSLRPAKLWNQELAKLWNHEPTKLWNQELAKLRNRESAEFGNLLKTKFGGYDAWRFSCIRDSGTSKKPSQRHCLKSPGLTCELVQACKRHSCICSH